MYARVAKWEGMSPEVMRKATEDVDTSSGPPPGVPAKGFMMLTDPESGRSLGIVLFETEEDMRTGDAALNAMNPDMGEGGGQRSSVEMYEVAVDVRV